MNIAPICASIGSTISMRWLLVANSAVIGLYDASDSTCDTGFKRSEVRCLALFIGTPNDDDTADEYVRSRGLICICSTDD